jgi:hypothetical protein
MNKYEKKGCLLKYSDEGLLGKVKEKVTYTLLEEVTSFANDSLLYFMEDMADVSDKVLSLVMDKEIGSLNLQKIFAIPENMIFPKDSEVKLAMMETARDLKQCLQDSNKIAFIKLPDNVPFHSCTAIWDRYSIRASYCKINSTRALVFDVSFNIIKGEK